MTFLITAVLLALGFSYFATNNPQGVNITLGSYFWPNVPLYLVALGSLLLGLFLSWMISLIDSFFTSIHLFQKDRQIKDTENELAQLRNKVHQLEAKNTELNTHKSQTVEIIDHHPVEQPVSLFDRIRQNLST